jgi:hypothetical protein
MQSIPFEPQHRERSGGLIQTSRAVVVLHRFHRALHPVVFLQDTHIAAASTSLLCLSADRMRLVVADAVRSSQRIVQRLGVHIGWG